LKEQGRREDTDLVEAPRNQKEADKRKGEHFL